MENGPFEHVFPIEDGIFHCYVSLPEGICLTRQHITGKPQKSGITID